MCLATAQAWYGFDSSGVTEGCWYILCPTRKGTNYSDHTRDLSNIFPTKLNTDPRPLLYLLQVTQKKFRILSVQAGHLWRNDLCVPRKMSNFKCFLVQRTGSSATGPNSENRVSDQDIGRPGRTDSSGLKVPGEPGHCRVWTRLAWWNYRGICPSSVLELH
jgi:hypothetical protein